MSEDSRLDALLQALAAAAHPLLNERCTGRIVINFSGGDKVRLEVARFEDVQLDARRAYNEGIPNRRRLHDHTP